MWARILNALLGVWLMAAPAVLGYGGAAAINDRIVGPLGASFAIIAIAGVTRPVRRVNAVLGFWLLVAPWLLGYPNVAAVNSMLVGIAAFGLSFVRGTVKDEFGGGWSVLWGGRGSAEVGVRNA